MKQVSLMKRCGGNQMAPELNFWNVAGVALHATPHDNGTTSGSQFSRSIVITDKNGTFEIHLYSDNADSLQIKELEV